MSFASMRLGLGLRGSIAAATRISLSPSSATAGVLYTGTLSGNIGATTATSSDGTTLTVVGSTVTGTFAAAGSVIITITDTVGSVLISFTVTASAYSPSLDFSDDRNSQYL